MFKKSIKWLLALCTLMLVTFTFLYKADLSLHYLREKYTDAASSFVIIEQMDVHFKDQGEGKTILLLHGTASSLHTWQGWTDDLVEDYRVVSLDLPAFGLTGPFVNADYSIEHYSSFLKQFVDKLGIEDFIIVGNSLGGHIALQFSIDHGDYVDEIVLLNPSGLPTQEERPLIFTLAQNNLSALLLRNMLPKSIIKKNLEAVYYDDTLIRDDLIDRYYELALRPGNREAFIDRAKTNSTSLKQLNLISKNTLIMWGKYDEWIPVANAEKFHKLIPQSSIVIFEHAGHVPMEEIPEESVQVFRTFIEKK